MSATMDDLMRLIEADTRAGNFLALAPCRNVPVTVLEDSPHYIYDKGSEGRVEKISEAMNFVNPNIQDTPLVLFFYRVRHLARETLLTMNGIHKADSPQAVSYAFYLWLSDDEEPPLAFDLPVIAWVKPGQADGPELHMRKENWDEWVRVYRVYHLTNDAPDNIDPTGFRP